MNYKDNKIYIFLEKVFNDEVTKEDYYWHLFLIFSNIFLSFIAILEIVYWDYASYEDLIHKIELIFGGLFLFEFIMRLIFVYIPNSVYFNWYMVLNFIVILTLLVPQVFGNLAVLRLIRSLKIIKIYKNLKEVKKMKKELNS